MNINVCGVNTFNLHRVAGAGQDNLCLTSYFVMSAFNR